MCLSNQFLVCLAHRSICGPRVGAGEEARYIVRVQKLILVGTSV